MLELKMSDVQEICKKFDKQYHLTNYAIYTYVNNKPINLCYTGSDIMDADNIRIHLAGKYPNKGFFITNEFVSFE